MKYRDIGKEIYQLEVPIALCSKVPDNYTKRSGTNSVQRFYTPELSKLVRHYLEFKDRETVLLSSLYSRVLIRFSQFNEKVWFPVIRVITQLDCLMSLESVHSKLNACLSGGVCRPKFINSSYDFCEKKDIVGAGDSYFQVKGLVHPCVVATGKVDFIPNDIRIFLLSILIML